MKVNQPHAIRSHSSFIEGVGLHDWLLEKHPVTIPGKQWHFCLITRLIYMAVVNGYVIYKKIHGSKLMPIKGFRSYNAVTYLKKIADSNVIRGRPVQRQITSINNMLPDIKFDKIQHVISKREKQRRCNLDNCSLKPRIYCINATQHYD